MRFLIQIGAVIIGAWFSVGSAHSPVRIASPWPAQNTVIVMLGYGENIVGTSAIAQHIPLLSQSLPGIKQVPAVGFNSGHELNPEQIIALNTQLLFIPAGMSLAQPDKLRQAGVKILAYPANSMTALVNRVVDTGRVLGPDAQARAQAWQRYFNNNVERVKKRLKDLPENQRLSVYHSMGSPLITSGRPLLNQDWMDLAGARNVAENWFGPKPIHAGEALLEKIVTANPQVIVAMNARDAREIAASPQWAGLDAVIHHRVYTNPKGIFWWCRETSEQALQFLWLAKTLYPERFADIDMREETRNFYRTFFNINLTDRQIAAILSPDSR